MEGKGNQTVQVYVRNAKKKISDEIKELHIYLQPLPQKNGPKMVCDCCKNPYCEFLWRHYTPVVRIWGMGTAAGKLNSYLG